MKMKDVNHAYMNAYMTSLTIIVSSIKRGGILFNL